MKIYTKTGDKGMTSLYDGSKRAKGHVIFYVLGDIDELSSHIGLLCAKIQPILAKPIR
jgi:cob(I)alamin adenosyltransferase